jgi:Ca2+/Na+ antiporter
MENNAQDPNSPQTPPVEQPQPPAAYPAPDAGSFAGQPTPAVIHASPDIVQAAPDKYSTWSLVIFVLLLLTFFSPLGSALFLPIVVVGLAAAVKQAHLTAKQSSQNANLPQSIVFTFFRVLVIVGTVIVMGILGIIGLFFILIATGAVNFRMGS